MDLPGEKMDIDPDTASDVRNYDELRPAVAAGFYRAITGDDRISDRDAAQRALPFVPSLNLSQKTFDERTNIIKTAIQLRQQAGVETRTPIDPSESQRIFYDTINNARKSSRSGAATSSTSSTEDPYVAEARRRGLIQ